jgi:hypothetical protein
MLPTPRLLGHPQAQRANDLRFGRVVLVADLTEAGILPQGDDEVCQRCIVDAALELPVEDIRRGLQKRILVNVLDGLIEFGVGQKRALERIGKRLEPLVGAEARP